MNLVNVCLKSIKKFVVEDALLEWWTCTLNTPLFRFFLRFCEFSFPENSWFGQHLSSLALIHPYSHSVHNHIIYFFFYICNEVTVAYFISRWGIKKNIRVFPHPDSWKLLKLPSLCLSFRLTRALSGCVLTGPFCWTQSLFCGHLPTPSFYCKVFVKKNRVFSFLCSALPSDLIMLLLLAVLSTAVRSLVLNMLFITLREWNIAHFNVDFCLERCSLASVVMIFCSMAELLEPYVQYVEAAA